ncbi:nitroreductase/quinone reductase family protein [Amycolatopsis umgeniensis]|uniref:Deazaflavin-dependent oxidoreductase (Nitroreductase family) n=1 Tax=Amycolatopsis umgeniensis TaxID=336628 RepID=A0A841AZZ7_9PSEU|nr:nitroreductase/quinone reductase family protein [Amycolatopsis umgeniensis]MBB5852201.1 deazaflavin-dependent oxidoreductase (nitroreductase family) [Amycolatopsis umgeniensis]
MTGFNDQVIEEFRQNKGKLGGMFEGWELILLTTTGVKSGKKRTNPLGYLEIDGKTVIVASNMGAPRHPGWYHNIRHDHRVTIETGTESYEAIAAVPPAAERDALFAKVVAEDPGFAEYQAKTTRELPVVILHRIDDRVRGMGDFLVEVHEWLREELETLRAGVEDIVAGRADSLTMEKSLRAHCVSFCEALTKHHAGEDMGAFPMLAQRFPALAPALTKLGEDHVVVAGLQKRIRDLVEGYVHGESDPVRLRGDFDALAGKLEAHFAYEERTVVAALNVTAPAPG